MNDEKRFDTDLVWEVDGTVHGVFEDLIWYSETDSIVKTSVGRTDFDKTEMKRIVDKPSVDEGGFDRYYDRDIRYG